MDRENVSTFKKWVGKENAHIIYDSDVDEFTQKMFNEKCLRKKTIAVIGFTTENDVFGGYLEIQVEQTNKYLLDQNHFIFSFKSNGRSKNPVRFFKKKRKESSVWWETNEKSGFIDFGYSGHFWLGDMESNSFCQNLSIDYEEIKDTTLTGKNGNYYGPYHHCQRLVVVQFN